MDDEKGTAWGIHSRLYYTHGAFPSVWGNYDHGFLLPRNSAFWLRASAGKSFGDFTSPFASFYFGAFGNNYIDHLSIDRYRDYYSFPGVGIDAMGARSFGKLLGEYNLPPKRFRELGTTWAYVNWARLTLFSSGLITNFTSDRQPRLFCQRRNATGFSRGVVYLLEHDAFRRLRRRGRSQRPRHHRIHGLAADSLMFSPAAPVVSRAGQRERASGADFSVRAGVDRHLQTADARPRAAIGGRGMRGGGGLLWPQHRDLCVGDRSPAIWARSGAPVIEEIAKALYVAWLLRSNRVGFMVDTAISGFAVGAGFAVLENLTYIPDLSASGLVASAIRGLGTAMMHGGATAIFGTVSANVSEIRGSRSPLTFLPGLAMAIAIHELYNQPLWRPVIAAVVVLVTLPAVIAFIFWRSEKVLEKWLGTKLDKDIDLLQMIATGTFSKSPVGVYAVARKYFHAGDSGRHAFVSAPVAGAERARQRRFAAPRDGLSRGAGSGACRGN